MVERHIEVDPRCKRCGESESIIHLLFHCSYAQQVWRDAPFATSFEPRGITDLETSWSAICATPCLPPTGIISSQLGPWILWILWKERNRLVFDGFSASPEEALTMAVRAAKEWELGQKTEKKPTSAPTQQPFTPHPEATLVRTDAAWRKEDRKAGLGLTVKTARFEIRRKKPFCHVSSALVAEGLAIREALLFCREHGLKNISLESDSSQLIKALRSGEPLTDCMGSSRTSSISVAPLRL